MDDSATSSMVPASSRPQEIVKIVGDLPKLPPRFWFNGTNLFAWSSCIEMILRGRRLDHHVTKETPNSSDPKYDRWREQEGTIQYWFLENMADTPIAIDSCICQQ